MGKKGNWFSAVKKALNPETKENNKQESRKSKKKWFRKKKRAVLNTTQAEAAPTAITLPPTPAPPPVTSRTESAKLSVDKEQAKQLLTASITEPAKQSVDNEQTKHAYKISLATAKAAEAAVAAAQAAAEVVRLTAFGNSVARSKEELAAIKLQTAFRGYMARRTLRALRGLVRLKSMMQGQAVKRQTANTLKAMQTLAHVQTQIRERRMRMAEEIFARQQIQQKNAKEQARELEKSQQVSDGWDASGRTKAQIEAKLQSKHEAAIRRERTLAYAFTHQQAWKASSRSAATLFMDPDNPHWGWSWLERWLAARPWETATFSEKEHSNDNSPRTKGSKKIIPVDAILKSNARHHTAEKPFPTSISKQPRSSTARFSTSSVPSKIASSSAAARKLTSPSPRASPRASLWGANDDAKSTQSEQSRRPSVTSSTVRDDESLSSSNTVTSYLAATESAKGKSRMAGERNKSVTPDRLSVSSANKRASYPASPSRSRRSTSSTADNSVSEHI